ncbi:MAG: DUF952 domain-containing protein [Candidatus Limnocylindrales bacterium]
MRPTYHLVPAQTWAERDPATPYIPPSLEAEGFIHCSDGAAAMVVTANRHYRADPSAFLVLTVDLDATGSPWQFDDPSGIYPHVHGPIDPAAVLAAVPIPRAADGEFLPFAVGDLPPGIRVETIYVVEATYGPDAERLRPAVRHEHLARIGRLLAEGRVIEAGGHLDLSSALLLVRASSEAEALDLVAGDVYRRSGVWTTLRAKPFGRVVVEGQREV